MLYTVSRNLLWLFLRLGFKFRVTGRQHIPRSGGVILAANHVSYLDPPALGAASSRKVVFMARDTLFNNKVMSFWLRNVGVIPLKRHAAHLAALREAIDVVKKGKVIGLFPEGTRSVSGKLGKASPGVAFIAAQAGVPVVPVSINGTQNALPKNAKSLRFHNKIEVRFGAPLYIKKGADYEEAADLIMERIGHLGKEGGLSHTVSSKNS